MGVLIHLIPTRDEVIDSNSSKNVCSENVLAGPENVSAKPDNVPVEPENVSVEPENILGKPENGLLVILNHKLFLLSL